MTHDQLFKDLLHEFLKEFMELFFPDVAKRLDFSRVTFLDKEVFTDLPKGRLRAVDVLAQVYTLDGKPELILIHVEVEARRRRKFPFRMYEYHSLLRLRFRIPVFPLVVYLSPGAGDVKQETYRETLFGYEVVNFHYQVVSLPDKSADDYLEVDNLLAPALAALMQPSKIGRIQQKFRSLVKMAGSPENEARKLLLANVIETYLPLEKSEEEDFQRLLNQPGTEEVKEMISVYEERGIAKGIERGIAQGIVRGQRNALLKLMRRKFGVLPESVVAKVEALQTEAELDMLLERVLDASTLEEMGLSED